MKVGEDEVKITGEVDVKQGFQFFLGEDIVPMVRYILLLLFLPQLLSLLIKCTAELSAHVPCTIDI